jgi:hypothetical protein
MVNEFLNELPRRDLTTPSVGKALHIFLVKRFDGASVAVTHKPTSLSTWRFLAGRDCSGNNWDPGSYDGRESFVAMVFSPHEMSAVNRPSGYLLGAIICCSSPEQKRAVRKDLEDLRGTLEFCLKYADEIKALKATKYYAKETLLFPRGSDGELAYLLLKQAKAIIPDWVSLSFWRVSRTAKSLERVAELNPTPRVHLPNESISDWVNYYVDSLQSQNALIDDLPLLMLPRCILVYPTDVKDTELHVKLRREPYFSVSRRPRSTINIHTPTEEANCFALYYHLPDSISANQSGEYDGCVGKKLEQFVSKLFIPKGGYAILLSNNDEVMVDIIRKSTGLTDEERRSSRSGNHDWQNKIAMQILHCPFQTIFALIGLPATNKSTNVMIYKSEKYPISFSDLHSLSRALNLAFPYFDLISSTRLHFRFLTVLIDRLSQNSSLNQLPEILSKGLLNILGTPHFVIVDHNKGEIELTSQSLANFSREKLNIEAVQRDGLFYESKIGNLSGTTVVAIRDELIAKMRKRLPEPQNPNLKKDWEVLMNVGFAAARISHSHSLVVFQERSWGFRALEAAVLKVIAASLKTIKFSNAIVPDQTYYPFTKFDKYLYGLMGSQDIVNEFARQIITLLSNQLSRSPSLLFAVDRNAKFFQPLYGYRSSRPSVDKAYALTENNLVAYCHKQRKELSAKKVEEKFLENPDGTQIPFLGLVEMSINDVAWAFPLGGVGESAPLAILVVTFPAATVADLTKYEKQLEFVRTVASLTSDWFLRKQTTIFRDVRSCIQDKLDNLRSEGISTYSRKLSEVQNDGSQLPHSFKRIFTKSYRSALQQVLEIVGKKTAVKSITLRIRDPNDLTSQDKIWLLASFGRVEAPTSYKFNPRLNVHSYVGARQSPSQTVFLPDVTDTQLSEKLYPDIHYQSVGTNIHSELCISIILTGVESLRATLNVENDRVEPLWLYQELFEDVGHSLGIEILSRFDKANVVDSLSVELAVEYVKESAHAINRSALTLGQMAALQTSKDSKLYSEINKHIQLIKREMKTEATLEIWLSHQDFFSEIKRLVEDIKSRAEELTKHRVKVQPDICFQNAEEPSPHKQQQFPWSPEIGGLLGKLLFEQVYTLDKIVLNNNNEVNEVLVKVGVTLSQAAWSIYILNTANPSEQTRALSEYLFWYEIDGHEERDGAGVCGLGLMLLGIMLRSKGISAQAHPRLDKERTKIYGEEYCGIWIELKRKFSTILNE